MDRLLSATIAHGGSVPEQMRVYFHPSFPNPALVLRILNDARSWGIPVVETKHRAQADWIVVYTSSQDLRRLVSPENAKLSQTYFKGSEPPITFFNSDNWASSPNPRHTLDSYRIYVVNHEFGHVLGHGHRRDTDGLCNIMYQQTKPSRCLPCPWPKTCGF